MNKNFDRLLKRYIDYFILENLKSPDPTKQTIWLAQMLMNAQLLTNPVRNGTQLAPISHQRLTNA